MEHVRGRVLDGAEVLADGAEITLVVNRWGGPKNWYGCIVVSSRTRIAGPGAPLRLEFEDGRSGEILVRKTKPLAAGQTTVFFDGAGALV